MSNAMKHPSAFIPIAMSLGALATLAIHIALFGVTHEADEGTAAHIWQLLMAGQLPVIAIFVLMWLPRAPKQTLQIVAVQVVAALAAFAPVYWLEL
jgi:mannose/fructose/N-acetylgalactosamine-specific phosphotransferase system component IID